MRHRAEDVDGRGGFSVDNSTPDHAQADSTTGTTRRQALRFAGAGASLAALATIRFGDRAQAQDATPVAGTTKEGAYAVFRTRVVLPDKSIDDLTAAIREGLVPIIMQIPGYIDYYIVQNFDTRQRTGVAIFADKAGADESTAKAGEF